MQKLLYSGHDIEHLVKIYCFFFVFFYSHLDNYLPMHVIIFCFGVL